MGRPARVIPDDFADVFVREGWDAADHYATRADKIARWLDETGRDELRKRRKNYIMGNRMSRGVSSLKPVPQSA